MACHRFDITLVWVPGHRNIEGNEKADELARCGSALCVSHAEEVFPPLGYVKREILLHFTSRAGTRWMNLTNCVISRKIWPTPDDARTNNLLARTRADVARLTAISTGHWPLGTHAAKLGIPHNTHCRSCADINKSETVFHLLCECPALAKTRRSALGHPFYDDLSAIQTIHFNKIIKFLNSTGWF